MDSLSDLLEFYLDLLDHKDEIAVSKSPTDQEWNIINSLYYCSSLYTTVGKILSLIMAVVVVQWLQLQLVILGSLLLVALFQYNDLQFKKQLKRKQLISFKLRNSHVLFTRTHMISFLHFNLIELRKTQLI